MQNHLRPNGRATRAYLAIFATTALTFFSPADVQATITQVVVRPHQSVSQRFIADVAFDPPVCLATQEPGVLPQFQPPATSLLQTRVEGAVVSIVLDVSAPTTQCLTSNVLTYMLPPLVGGTYTLRVADSKLTATGVLYYNNVVQSAASTQFTVPSNTSTAIPIFLQSGNLGTTLSSFDAGAYQYAPTYASDTGHWQPVFYAWPWSGFSFEDGEFRRIYALVTRFPNLPERFFYTIDIRERNALIASGAFADPAPGSASATFAAIPASGGVCPSARVPIYRAFEPKAVIHRYVPLETYRALTSNGWTGEGISFCAAAEPAGASSWGPN